MASSVSSRLSFLVLLPFGVLCSCDATQPSPLASQRALLLAKGATCSQTAQCSAGLTCVDGVCCGSACDGQCESCDAVGDCVPTVGVPKGARPACTGGSAPCAATCDGRRVEACTFPDARTVCPGYCDGAEAHPPSVCDGAGACIVPNGPLKTAQADELCANGYIVSKSSEDCAASPGICEAGTWCGEIDVPGLGKERRCVPQQSLGTACSDRQECAQGAFCADGVCCETQCDSQTSLCSYCALPGPTLGHCAPVPKGQPRGTRASCAACYVCDGIGGDACAPTPAAACGKGKRCEDGRLEDSLCVNELGEGWTCQTSTLSCDGYACESSACLSECSEDSECASAYYCDEAHECVPKIEKGEACDADGQCVSGFCTDRVCCEERCDGQCQNCGLNFHVGECFPVSGPNPRPESGCDGDGSDCQCHCVSGFPAYRMQGQKCDDSETDRCESQSGKLTPADRCDGIGACVSAAAMTCTQGCADATRCKLAGDCLVDADCGSVGMPCGGECRGGKCAFPNAGSTCTAGSCAAGQYTAPGTCDQDSTDCLPGAVTPCLEDCADTIQCTRPTGNICEHDADCGPQGAACSGQCVQSTCVYPNETRICAQGGCDLGSGKYRLPATCDGQGECQPGDLLSCILGCENPRECTVAPTTCQSDIDCGSPGAPCGGTCEVATGLCDFSSEGKPCAASSCDEASRTLTKEATCDALGRCRAPTAEVCEWGCSETACLAQAACSTDSECPSGQQCMSGACVRGSLAVSGGACSTTGGGEEAFFALLAAALAGLIVSTRRWQRRLARPPIVGLLLASTLSSAASPEASFEIQRFRPLGGAEDILGVESALTPGHLRWGLGAFVNYGYHPLVVRDTDTDAVFPIVDHQAALDLTGTIGLGERFEVSAALPITFWASNGDEGTAGVPVASVSGASLSALRLTPKFRLASLDTLSFAVSAPLSIPIGGGDYLQDAGPAFNPRLLAEWRGPFRVAANLGYLIRAKEDWNRLDLGGALTYGVGVVAPLWSDDADQLDLLATIVGEYGVRDASAFQHPAEASGAVRWTTSGLSLLGGVGLGISSGYGTPDFRLLAGLGYTPGVEPGEPAAAPPPDPVVVPAPAPREAFVARDDAATTPQGRPVVIAALENDSGGAAPYRVMSTEPGSLGTSDILPDGRVRYSPDPCKSGSDAFRYLAVDAEGERSIGTVQVSISPNPSACPSTVLQSRSGKAKFQGDQIIILEPIFFDTGKDVILKRSYPIVNAVAELMAANPHVRHIRVEGHTDNVGQPADNLDLSRRRARSVVRYLVARGIAPTRFESEGYGESRPVDTNKTAKGRARNRRVQFVILP